MQFVKGGKNEKDFFLGLEVVRAMILPSYLKGRRKFVVKDLVVAIVLHEQNITHTVFMRWGKMLEMECHFLYGKSGY